MGIHFKKWPSIYATATAVIFNNNEAFIDSNIVFSMELNLIIWGDSRGWSN